MKRNKVEKFFRDYLTELGIDCSRWQCIVRITEKNYRSTTYDVKFYWSNGYFDFVGVYSENGQIKDFKYPELHSIGV